MNVLYDDENNIVDAVVADAVVQCESGGVEVSNVEILPSLTTSPSLSVITMFTSPRSLPSRNFLRSPDRWQSPKDTTNNALSPSTAFASFMTARQNDEEDTAGRHRLRDTATPSTVNIKYEEQCLFDDRTVLSDDSGDSDPFAPRAGKCLRWRNVDMVLRSKKGSSKRKILDNVWGEVPPKLTTAIMGASGSGKTSLLNVLSGRVCSKGPIKIASEVQFDDILVKPTNIQVRKKIAFVAQDDSLQATATPREAIKFSARLRLPRSTANADIDKLAEKMIDELGLTACADTIVGGPLMKGISGGERKRTSVGVELVVKPSMVFLDEPTSGLDSYNALQLCQVLRKVAAAGASVLFTIHQPSSEIFNAFDHLILLNQGKVMYQGAVENTQDYFENRGHPCPCNYNPADWFIAVAQNNTVEELEETGFFPGHPEEEDREKILARASTLTPGSDDSFVSVSRQEQTASVGTQLKLLFIRELMHMYRFRYPLYARYGLTIMLSTLIGTIFYGIGETDKTDPYNLQSHFGAMMCTLMMALLGTAQPSLLFFPEERPIFLREYSTDHYGVLAYFLSRFFVEAAVTGIQVMFMVSIIFYLASFQGSFFIFLSATYALSLSGTAMAVTLGAASQGNTKVAQQMLPLIFIPQVVFSGFFIAPDMIPTVLRWVQHVCVLTYAVRLVVVSEFVDCSEEPLQAFTCDILVGKVDADPERNWYYWMMLVVFFVFFRSFALVLLSKSARNFY